VGERHTTPRTGPDPTKNQQRLTVHDAARVLGISEDAVRMRIKRGTLPADKQGGRLHVYLTTDPTPEPTPDRTDALIAELQDRVRSLEEANSENRRIIAALTSRIPQLEAPRETPEAAETATPGPEGSPRSDAGGAQTAPQRPWWRRVFGG
jgi:excisionase family DNA binding protein